MNGLTKKEFLRALDRKSQWMFGRTSKTISKNQLFKAISMVVRDLIMERWAYSRETVHRQPKRELYYLSMEFLMGQALGNNVHLLEIQDIVEEVCQDFGIPLEELYELEPDAGLGNGGLGRLAACFMDSLATLGMPAHGYGIRYEYGLFKQKIVDGYQIELVDPWLEDGNVWEIALPEEAQFVRFGGYVKQVWRDGKLVFEHQGYQQVKAIPYEMPILGYRSSVANTLVLWGARSVKHMDMDLFGQGKYINAMEEKELAEVISKVLYPEDNHLEGKALRLKQQYFFVSATMQHIVSNFKAKGNDVRDLAKKIVIQINDTHPALSIPELMRILIDEEHLGWEEAWDITTHTFAYTNHTIMEEALEKWPVDLFRDLLPRLWDIVYEINERFCRELWEKYPGDWDRIASMAIIADGQVKMAHLCIVGSSSVNGVAQLHANILKELVFKDFHEFYPGKFTGITNGITFRRFLLQANPRLTELITAKIGSGWLQDPLQLKGFAEFSQDEEVQAELRHIRYRNKLRLATYIEKHNGIKVDPNSIFDVQIKRLHEYKRQLLNVLHIMALYNRLLENSDLEVPSRTFVFGAKAAPGYRMAKLIIKLIHSVGEAINSDPRIHDRLKVVFLENYRVSLAELIIPAADISEQISTAGKEASGTGNMKFMVNGALTVGTLDGANVEIFEEVGPENIFIFGLTSALVNRYYQTGSYQPLDILAENQELNLVLEQLINGFLPVEHPDIFQEIYDGLKYGNGGMADPYFVIKDFASYSDAQRRVDATYQRPQKWWAKAIINIAHAGRFSSDRTIDEYDARIWHLPRFSTL